MKRREFITLLAAAAFQQGLRELGWLEGRM
jgi:hypothetical protein